MADIAVNSYWRDPDFFKENVSGTYSFAGSGGGTPPGSTGLSWLGNTANGVGTYVDANTIQAESTLTYSTGAAPYALRVGASVGGELQLGNTTTYTHDIWSEAPSSGPVLKFGYYLTDIATVSHTSGWQFHDDIIVDQNAFIATDLVVGNAAGEYGAANHTATIGSTTLNQYGDLELLGNRTTNARLGSIGFLNAAATGLADRRVVDVYAERDDNDAYGALNIDVAGSGGLYNAYRIERRQHTWYMDNVSTMILDYTTDSLMPSTNEGANIGNAVIRWNDGRFASLYADTHYVGGTGIYITSDSAGNMIFADNVLSNVYTLSDLIGGGTVSFGSNNEIPSVNATTDDFDYSANFRYDGTRLYVDGASSQIRITDTDDSQSWYLNANAGSFSIVDVGGIGAFTINTNNTVASILSLTSDVARINTTLQVDTIDEYTTSAGVTIEGVLMSNSYIEAPSYISSDTYIRSGTTGYEGNYYLHRSSDGSIGGRIFLDGTSVFRLLQTSGVKQDIRMSGANGIEFRTEETSSPYDLYTRMSIANGDNAYVSINHGLNVDIINEYTTSAGVTIETILLEDGQISLDGTDSNPGIYITYDSAGNMVFEDQVVSASQTLSDLIGGGSGTVTSVGLSLPSEFNVTGSPVTISGTLSGAWTTQTANTIFSGPSSGGAAVPAFRTLVDADMPASYDEANWDTAYSHSQITTGNPHSIGYADISDFSTGVSTYETSHTDVVVDGDFSTNGILRRTGVGSYASLTGSSSVDTVEDTLTQDSTHIPTSNAVYDAIAAVESPWDRSSAGEVSFATLGDDLVLAGDGTERILFGDTNARIYKDGTHVLHLVVDGSIQLNASVVAHYDIDPNGTNQSIGGTTSYWENGYFNNLYVGDTGISITSDSAGNLVFADNVASAPQTLSDLIGGGTGSGYWDETSAGYIVLATSGDDVLLQDNTERLLFGSTTAYAYTSNNTYDNIAFVTDNLLRFIIGRSGTITDCNISYLDVVPNTTGIDLGSVTHNLWWDNLYVNTVYLESTSSYIDVESDGQMSFTDAVNGTVKLGDLSAGDVSSSGTPADNQLAIWTNANTIEGDSNLTWDASSLNVSGDIVLAANQDKLYCGPTTNNTYIETSALGELTLVQSNSIYLAMLTNVTLGSGIHLSGWADKANDIGTSGAFFRYGYFDSIYIDNTSTYINVESDTQMSFTDAVNGTVKLGDLISSSPWQVNSNLITVLAAGDDVRLNTTEQLQFNHADTYIQGPPGGTGALHFIANTAIALVIQSSQISIYQPLVAQNNQNLGSTGSAEWFTNVYAGTYQFAATGYNINTSGSDMRFTDGSNTNVTLSSLVAGGIDMTNGSNNRITTAVDADTINAEQYLTFDGTKLYVGSASTLGSTAGDTILMFETDWDVGSSNNMYYRVWALREDAGSDWFTSVVHHGISIDSSYGTPGTNTRAWIEQDPYNQQVRIGNTSETLGQFAINQTSIGGAFTKLQTWSDYALVVGHTGTAERVNIEMHGNVTSDLTVGALSAHNEASTSATKCISQIKMLRDGDDEAGQIVFEAAGTTGTLVEWMKLRYNGVLEHTATAGTQNMDLIASSSTATGGTLRLSNSSTGALSGSDAGLIEFYKADASTQGAGIVSQIYSTAIDSGGTYNLYFETGQDVETPAGTNSTMYLTYTGELYIDASQAAFLSLDSATSYDSYTRFRVNGSTTAIMGWDTGLSAFQIHTGTAFTTLAGADFSIGSSGAIYMGNLGNNSTSYYLYYDLTTNAVTYATTSDVRLKTNIKLWEPDSLQFLVAQDIIHYDKKDGTAHNVIGYNANQMSELMPDMTWKDDAGYWNFKDADMRYHYHRAIKQLAVQDNDQEEKIRKLQEEIQELKDLLDNT